jgi:hypothetical protein
MQAVDLSVTIHTSPTSSGGRFTRLKHLLPGPKKCHGSEMPHWKAAASSEATPHTAMNVVKVIPNLRCRSEAVSIIINEMIESFARARVAM